MGAPKYSFCISGGVTGVGTSYSTSKRVSVDVSFSLRPYFHSVLKSIQVDISNISGPATINLQITADAAGDEILLPDTQATIAPGITTAAKGNAVINVDTVLYSTVETFYVFIKGNSGTMDIDSITLNIENN